MFPVLFVFLWLTAFPVRLNSQHFTALQANLLELLISIFHFMNERSCKCAHYLKSVICHTETKQCAPTLFGETFDKDMFSERDV